MIDEKLKEDKSVLNYGVYGVYREQALTAGNYFKTGDLAGGVDASDLIRRDLSFWAYSAWAKFLWRQLEVEFEHAGIVGDVGSSAIGGSFGAKGDPPNLNVCRCSICEISVV